MHRDSEAILFHGDMGQKPVKRTRQPLTPLCSTTVLRDDSDLVSALHAAALQKGESVAVLDQRDDLTLEVFAQHVMRWVEMEARIVGGCCAVGPAHIQYLGRALVDSGRALTHRLYH